MRRGPTRHPDPGLTLPPAGDGPGPDAAGAVAAAYRDHWATVLSIAARTAQGDLSIAEDATQDAFVAALDNWTTAGVPDNPAGWLTRTAKRRVVDALRRTSTLQRKLPALLDPESNEEERMPHVALLDDRLRLIFTCCHPALALDSRIALTLRMVGGLTTGEIAAGFLVQEATMAARLTRAKKKITSARIPYRVPDDAELPDRIDGVLAVISLIYTAGHTAPSGSGLQRRDLAADALDLARMLVALAPDEPEPLGLLAMLELTDSRKAARESPDGGIVLLEEQDRSLWDQQGITRGLAALRAGGQRLGPTRPPGRFLLQGGLAAVHAEASTFDETDWSAAVQIYDQLLGGDPSPVVALNRAVAISYRDGPASGLAAVEELALDPRLACYHYLPATRADLLRRLGRSGEAADAYRQALDLVSNEAERVFLQGRLAQVEGTG